MGGSGKDWKREPQNGMGGSGKDWKREPEAAPEPQGGMGGSSKDWKREAAPVPVSILGVRVFVDRVMLMHPSSSSRAALADSGRTGRGKPSRKAALAGSARTGDRARWFRRFLSTRSNQPPSLGFMGAD